MAVAVRDIRIPRAVAGFRVSVSVGELVKVGPEGYIHGWINVGPGDAVPVTRHGFDDKKATDIASRISHLDKLRDDDPDETSVKRGIMKRTQYAGSAVGDQDLLNVEHVVKRSPYVTKKPLYRGIHTSNGDSDYDERKAVIDQVKNLRPGDTITTDNSASWSSDERVAHLFSQSSELSDPTGSSDLSNVMLRNITGIHALPVSWYGDPKYAYQSEYVAPSGKFTVVSNENHHDYPNLRVITVEEVPRDNS